MPNFQHLRVLVVDDNEEMRTLLRRMLRSLGVTYIKDAVDGRAGIELLDTAQFDVILSDLDMKPMNGIDFTCEVRASRHCSYSMLPIIMVTGHTERHIVENARDVGITEFIVKPVSVKLLQSRLTEVFERPRAFVRGKGYIGPDRRRSKRHRGLRRRACD